MIRKNIYISTIQDDKLQLLSKISGLKMSELIRRAIDNFIENKINNVVTIPKEK